MIESWCKFRRKCLLHEKILSEYVQTQPVLTLSDIVSKVKPRIHANLSNKKVGTPLQTLGNKKVNLPAPNRGNKKPSLPIENIKTSQVCVPSQEKTQQATNSANVQAKRRRGRPPTYNCSTNNTEQRNDQNKVHTNEGVSNQNIVKNEVMIKVEVPDYLEEVVEEKQVRMCTRVQFCSRIITSVISRIIIILLLIFR